MMKKLYIYAFMSVLLLVLSACSSTDTGDKDAAPTTKATEEVSKAPTVQLLNLDNELFDTATVDKPILYSFWASWCNYCQNEIPQIDELYTKYGDQVEFVSVNITYNDNLTDAKGFIRDRQIDMPVYFDIDGIAGTKFGVLAVPTLVLVDSNGQIVQQRVGPSADESVDDITDNLEKMLADSF